MLHVWYFFASFCACMIQTGAAVVQDQLEADEDASLQQRVLKSTGTVLGGAAEVIGEENEIIGGERVRGWRGVPRSQVTEVTSLSDLHKGYYT